MIVYIELILIYHFRQASCQIERRSASLMTRRTTFYSSTQDQRMGGPETEMWCSIWGDTETCYWAFGHCCICCCIFALFNRTWRILIRRFYWKNNGNQPHIIFLTLVNANIIKSASFSQNHFACTLSFLQLNFDFVPDNHEDRNQLICVQAPTLPLTFRHMSGRRSSASRRRSGALLLLTLISFLC